MRGSKRQRKKLAYGTRRSRRTVFFESEGEAALWFGKGSIGAFLAPQLYQGVRGVEVRLESRPPAVTWGSIDEPARFPAPGAWDRLAERAKEKP